MKTLSDILKAVFEALMRLFAKSEPVIHEPDEGPADKPGQVPPLRNPALLPGQLSPHFTLKELTYSATAAARGLDNTPSPEIVANLKALAQVLEVVREMHGNRMIKVTSGYRNPEVNRAVGGSSTSDHMTGNSVDFVIPGLDPYDVANNIANSGLKFDQLIFEQKTATNIWVHLGMGPRLRREIKSKRPGQPYQPGIVRLWK